MARGGDSKKRPAVVATAAAPPSKRRAAHHAAEPSPSLARVVAVAAACAPARAAFAHYERLIGGNDPLHASLDALLQQAAGEWPDLLLSGGDCECVLPRQNGERPLSLSLSPPLSVCAVVMTTTCIMSHAAASRVGPSSLRR